MTKIKKISKTLRCDRQEYAPDSLGIAKCRSCITQFGLGGICAGIGAVRTASVLRMFASLAAQALAAVSGLALSVVLARALGVEGLGKFTVLSTLIFLGSMFAKRGVDILVARASAEAVAFHSADEFPSIMCFAVWAVLKGSIPVCLVAVCINASGVLGESLPHSTITLFVTIPLFSLLALVATHFKGLRLTWLAPLFEAGGLSLVTAICFLFIRKLTALEATVVVSLSMMLSALVLTAFAVTAVLLVWKRHSVSLKGCKITAFVRKKLSSGQFDLTTIAVTTFAVQAGSFIIAAPFLSEFEVGLLRAAERLALIVSFPSLAVMPFIMANVAVNARLRDTAAQRSLMLRSGVTGVVLGVLPFVGLMLFAGRALQMMGDGFVQAAPYLRVLALVNLVAVALNPLTIFLNMAGHERVLMLVSLFTLVSALILYPILSYAFGGIGFVIAYFLIVVGRLVSVSQVSFQRLRFET